jgi:spermidine/putrescine transport system permease protein
VGRSLRARLAPYALIFPGGLWLLLFFVIPMVAMFSLSLTQGDVVNGFVQTWHWQTYVDAITNYKVQLVRSLEYGLVTTVIQVVIAFPVAYWIAFRGGRRKSTYLFLILLPFFVSFVLRTISWRFFLILGTAPAVIGGLTYNYVPFMVLPIYVALERIDPRVVEAARDLYASPTAVFRKVIFPLSLPGVFAGVLMTFVPTSSDYVNSELLGSSSTTMIGQVIQAQYLQYSSYPTASALSFTLMAVLLVGIFLYARILGTEDVLTVAAR